MADINPSVSLDRIKSDIVKGLKLPGGAEDYEIFISPNSKKDSLDRYLPANGDKIAILDVEDADTPAVNIR